MQMRQCCAHSHGVVNMSCLSILLAATLREGGADSLGRKYVSGGSAVCIMYHALGWMFKLNPLPAFVAQDYTLIHTNTDAHVCAHTQI